MAITHAQLGAQLSGSARIFRAIADKSTGAQHCSGHENVVAAGAVVPLHQHALEEVIVCLSGSAMCTVGNAAPQIYQAGSVIVIAPHTPHTIHNYGAQELRQLSVFAGAQDETTWIQPAGSIHS